MENRRNMMKVAVTVTAQITIETMAAMTTVRVDGEAWVEWGAAKVLEPASSMRTAMLPKCEHWQVVEEAFEERTQHPSSAQVRDT